jgi:AdoMet-dependent heme synthase
VWRRPDQEESVTAADPHAPGRIDWEVTGACDLACRRCRTGGTPARDELSTIEALRLLERFRDFGTPPPRVVLTGGDPLKRPDLFLLIAYARKLELGVSVAPGATALLTARMVAQLRDAEVAGLVLDVDGADAAVHDALWGPGCFERALAAAEAARSIGLSVQIDTLVAASTLREIPAIAGLVARTRAVRWRLVFPVPPGGDPRLAPISAEACEELLRWLAVRPFFGAEVATVEAPQFHRVLRQVPSPGIAPAGAAGVREAGGTIFIGHTAAIRPSGALPLAAGNVRTDDPVSVYRRSRLFRDLRSADLLTGRCGRCEFRTVCGGSRARAFAASGDPLGEDPLCTYRPAV